MSRDIQEVIITAPATVGSESWHAKVDVLTRSAEMHCAAGISLPFPLEEFTVRRMGGLV